MDVKKAIETRRAYRELEPIEVDEELIKDLAESASLAPSCYNKQPWRFVFVKSKEKLTELWNALPRGNSWVKQGSLIVAVFTTKKLDCVIGEREYFLFDSGLASAFLVLRATELGLVAHPIAGYDESRVKEVLKIPEDMRVITLIVIGKHKEGAEEGPRPERLKFEEFAWIDEVK